MNGDTFIERIIINKFDEKLNRIIKKTVVLGSFFDYRHIYINQALTMAENLIY